MSARALGFVERRLLPPHSQTRCEPIAEDNHVDRTVLRHGDALHCQTAYGATGELHIGKRIRYAAAYPHAASVRRVYATLYAECARAERLVTFVLIVTEGEHVTLFAAMDWPITIATGVFGPQGVESARIGRIGGREQGSLRTVAWRSTGVAVQTTRRVAPR